MQKSLSLKTLVSSDLIEIWIRNVYFFKKSLHFILSSRSNRFTLPRRRELTHALKQYNMKISEESKFFIMFVVITALFWTLIIWGLNTSTPYNPI
jgi:hypothetical protein